MQKYLIPKTLIKYTKENDRISYSLTLLLQMTIEYYEGDYNPQHYSKEQEYYFAPIRAEIDAGNKKKKKGPVNLIYPFDTPDFMEAWQLLLTQPKWSNKTQAALQLSLNRISVFAKSNVNDAIEIITNSIAGGYQGVFELKNKPTHAKQPTNADPIWRR